MVNFIVAFLTGVDVLIAFCMIILILMQQAKGGGGLGAIGGDSTSSVFGAGSGNVLTKTTTILAACFLAITLTLAVITGHRKGGASVVESADYGVEETAQNDDADGGENAAGDGAETGGQGSENGEGATPALQGDDGSRDESDADDSEGESGDDGNGE